MVVSGCAMIAAGLMPAADASALDFRSAGDAPVVLYDAPSTKATRILLLSPGSPVEVMTALDGWLRVREPGGRLAWAESKAVVTRRTLMVSVASATIRAAADAAATDLQPGRAIDLGGVDQAQRGMRLHRPGGARYADG